MFTRREALGTLVGAGFGGMLAAKGSARGAMAMEGGQQGIIDAHVHVWTPDTARYPLAAGFRRDEMKPASFTPTQLFEHAGPSGVKRVVLVQMSFYGFDNRYMLDVISDEPQVFSGIAVIDDSQPDPGVPMRELKEKGVRGFRIYPRNLAVDRWLDGEGLNAMWRVGAEEGLAMCHLINPDALPAVDRMCERYPDTPVVIDHFARIGVTGAIAEGDLKALERLARHRRTAVKVSAYYALGKKSAPYTDLVPMIRRLCEAFGPERLMWASDCPYQVDPPHTYDASVGLVRDHLDFLSDSDRAHLLWGTAERMFFTG